MKTTRKKSASSFARGLYTYVSIFFFVVGVALIVLWLSMDQHQKRVDAELAAKEQQEEQAAYDLAVSRAPQKAFESFLAEADAQTWADAWYEDHPANYDDPAQILALMDEHFSDPELKTFKARDYTDEHPRYAIHSDGEPLAYVSFTGSGLDWTVSDIDVLLEGGEEASLLVPEGYTVRCNGQLVDKSSAEAEVRLYDLAEYADLIVDPVHWETYTVKGQLSKPVLTAEAPEGRPISTAEDGTVFYVLPEEEAEEYQNRAERFIYSLLYYYMTGNIATRSNMYAALNHVTTDSPAYRLIANSYDGVIWDTCYGNAKYSAEAGDVRILASNLLMVDVVYHAEGSAAGYTNTADGIYRIYFLDTGRGFGIYNLAYV